MVAHGAKSADPLRMFSMAFPSRHMRQRARALRKRATHEERLLWSLVRNQQLGVPIRRQHPIGARRIVDFYCPVARLAIEIDGAHHHDLHDEVGDAFMLLEHGVDILRFSNDDVNGNVFDVLAQIRAAIAERVRGPSAPSPRSGDGDRGRGERSE